MDVERQSVRAARWRARAPRIGLLVACAVLSATGLRGLVAPPQARQAAAQIPAGRADHAVQAFAQAFARAYLSWDADDPERHERAVQRYASANLDPHAGLAVPQTGRSVLLGVDVSNVRRDQRGAIVTVAATTPTEVLHLAVTVARDQSGLLFVADYPALVGPPPANTRASLPDEPPIDDGAARRVAERALSNYLAGDRDDLLADLAAGAVVSLPERRMSLDEVREATWAVPGRRLALTVDVSAGPPDGLDMTLRYELDVARRAGRWLVRSVHSSAPDPPEVSE